ncbi:MAG: S8 family serine peptidase [Sphingomicrobium sp.]
MPPMRRFIAIILISAGSAASAQLLPSGALPGLSLPGGVGTGSVIDPVGRTIDQTLGDAHLDEVAGQVTRADVERTIQPSLSRLTTERWVQSAPPATLLDLRRLRLAELVNENRAALEMDGIGNPARRAQLIVIDPGPTALAAAVRNGYTIKSDELDTGLGIRTVTLGAPRGLSAVRAMARLRSIAPGIVADFDHVFEPAGGKLNASAAVLAARSGSGAGPVIGMIDGGVGRSPALASASIEQRGFAGAAQATGHGTAVASLMVGSDGRFVGAARGASLLVGDVYGGDPAAGSATNVVKALSWIASKRPAVINISLVGPRNALVERAISIVLARGIKVVAAVGNDGPAAPPLYPASQTGVIAVTGVDGTNRALAEAGRSSHLDYAGPGADMAAALPGRGYTRVRGTSFAAPFISARLAIAGSTARLDGEAAKGRGRVGRGIVCASCRIVPKLVGVR